MAGVIREGRRNGESGQLDSVGNAHGSHQVSAAPLLTSYAKVAPLLKRYESG